MKRARIIPVLNLYEGMLHKTQRFKDPIYLGDPNIAVRIFNDLQVDELIIIDYSNKEPNFELMEDLASEAFMPMVYGGGIKTVGQFEKVIQAGFEKVVLNTMPLESPSIVKELSETFGSSTLVASVDIKRNIFGKYNIFNRSSNSKLKKKDIRDYCSYLENLGFGEILFNLVDKESFMQGPDIELAKIISKETNIPTLYQGGIGSVDDIIHVLKESEISGVACGAFFVLNGKFRTPLISYLEKDDFKKIHSSIWSNVNE